ncbi:hypothetical protein HYPSUDRAFT_42934 [Hypholoma sublateritium FD-334 SS-4]|uniref:Uncharacterized protein n=1 Tax=Hypholoma sublateritium (strain FD-334 SS-4) TaxID=945553 RepID=A0A0D2NPA6_HYPSF|nr:hypothetical protein HYPSUDRAFT_42934 [Hypholoma sublateritium FD-334 SS-4]
MAGPADALPQLVLAFDIGTTYSGASYSIITNGSTPEIHGVARFPALADGSSKIPSIIYYDSDGGIAAVGAEALRGGIQVDAEDNHWTKVEWFKLKLPLSSTVDPMEMGLFDNLPPLPFNKTIVEVFADFYTYLLECSAKYICESHENGNLLWASVKDGVQFVLSHPNGWGGREQMLLRDAALLAGLIPNDTPENQDRVSFVTEGEASLNFVIRSGTLTASLKNGDGLLIVDAGGGTIDISSYRQMPDNTTTVFEEITRSHCTFSGSLLVDKSAKTFLTDFLQDSPYIEDVDHMVACFNKTCKPTFKNADDTQYIKFGSFRDNDAEHHIRAGELMLQGSDVANFFKPSSTAIKRAILDQRSSAHKKIVHVVLVGGFSANDWLFADIEAFLARTDPTLRLIRPKERASKAVSDGAVSFYIDHFVRARIAKATYGAICSARYNPTNKEHTQRAATTFVAPSGERRVPEMFCVIIAKDTRVSEGTEFRQTYNQVSFKKSYFQRLASPVWCYRGTRSALGWKDLDRSNFVQLCTIEADLSKAVSGPLKGFEGKTYYQANYEIVLLFGLTELKAQVAWKENVCRLVVYLYDPFDVH